MAESIIICGNTQVKIGGTVVGETDDGNDIRIKIIPGRKKIHTNLSGPELWEYIINLGCRAQITVPFQKVDEAVLGPWLTSPGGSEGQMGALGASTNSFALAIVPANGSGYYFATAWVMDSAEISKFGYEPKITLVTFEAQPVPANGATSPLYTRS